MFFIIRHLTGYPVDSFPQSTAPTRPAPEMRRTRPLRADESKRFSNLPAVRRGLRVSLIGLLLTAQIGQGALPGVADGAGAESSAGMQPAATEGSQTLYALVQADSCLNVRERPDLGAGVTLRLSRGDAVCLCGIVSGGWAQIDRAGDPGYCRIEYLTDAPPADPVEATVTLPGVRVRSLPQGKVIRKLRKGDNVSVLGWVPDADGNRWANIGDGFVLAACLSQSP